MLRRFNLDEMNKFLLNIKSYKIFLRISDVELSNNDLLYYYFNFKKFQFIKI